MSRRRPEPASPDAGTERVRLLKPHTHAGVRYDAGMEIHVAVANAHWLRERGVAAEAAIAELGERVVDALQTDNDGE